MTERLLNVVGPLTFLETPPRVTELPPARKAPLLVQCPWTINTKEPAFKVDPVLMSKSPATVVAPDRILALDPPLERKRWP